MKKIKTYKREYLFEDLENGETLLKLDKLFNKTTLKKIISAKLITHEDKLEISLLDKDDKEIKSVIIMKNK